MSTGLIIAIVVIVLILLALIVLLPRMRANSARQKAERELGSRRERAVDEHRNEAADREAAAEEAEQRARMAKAAAEKERAEANVQSERANMHERGMADSELVEDHERERFADVPDSTVDRDADGHTIDDRAREGDRRDRRTPTRDATTSRAASTSASGSRTTSASPTAPPRTEARRGRDQRPWQAGSGGGPPLDFGCLADVAQLVEHFTRNEGVPGSSPGVGSPGERGMPAVVRIKRIADLPRGVPGAVEPSTTCRVREAVRPLPGFSSGEARHQTSAAAVTRLRWCGPGGRIPGTATSFVRSGDSLGSACRLQAWPSSVGDPSMDWREVAVMLRPARPGQARAPVTQSGSASTTRRPSDRSRSHGTGARAGPARRASRSVRLPGPRFSPDRARRRSGPGRNRGSRCRRRPR